MTAGTEIEHGAEVAAEDNVTKEATISEMAQVYGISLRSLRFYEDKGLLSPGRRGTARYYSADDRARVELILKGKRLGFSLAEISALLSTRSSLREGVVQSQPSGGSNANAALAAATATFGSAEKARRWLKRPTHLFGGMTPMDVLATVDGGRRIEDVLKRIDHGLAV